MGLGTKTDYNIESHANVTLSDLTRVSDETVINAATVKAYLCEPAKHPDVDSEIDTAHAGEVGISIANHGMSAGDYILIFESINYDLGYKILTGNTTTAKIFFAATQTAETFHGNEDVYKVVTGSVELTLIHSGPDGYFSAVMDEAPVMIAGQSYFRIITVVVTGTNEKRVFVNELNAKYG